MRQRNRSLALALALALVLVACGESGGDDHHAPPDATTTTAADDHDRCRRDHRPPTAKAMSPSTLASPRTRSRVGLLADLSGPFAPLVQDIVAAQEVYWDLVNEGGGIAGRQIELIVEDTAYNPDQHRTKYEAIRDQVAIISQSTGSPQTAGVIDLMLEDDIVAIPLDLVLGLGRSRRSTRAPCSSSRPTTASRA